MCSPLVGGLQSLAPAVHGPGGQGHRPAHRRPDHAHRWVAARGGAHMRGAQLHRADVWCCCMVVKRQQPPDVARFKHSTRAIVNRVFYRLTVCVCVCLCARACCCFRGDAVGAGGSAAVLRCHAQAGLGESPAAPGQPGDLVCCRPRPLRGRCLCHGMASAAGTRLPWQTEVWAPLLMTLLVALAQRGVPPLAVYVQDSPDWKKMFPGGIQVRDMTY